MTMYAGLLLSATGSQSIHEAISEAMTIQKRIDAPVFILHNDLCVPIDYEIGVKGNLDRWEQKRKDHMYGEYRNG